MRSWKMCFLAVVFLLVMSPAVWASPSLYEWAINDNGAVTDVQNPYEVWNTPVETSPGVFQTFSTPSGFSSILGTTTLTYSGGGTYSALAYFDYDFAYNTSNPQVPFDDRYGSVSGTPAATQSWEIGSVSSVWSDFSANTLNGANGVPAGTANPYTTDYTGDDIATVLGYNFTLQSYQTATVTFTTSTTAPAGFYLEDTSSTTGETVYLTSNIDIEGTAPVSGVPEPATLTFLALTIVGGIVAARGKRSREDSKL
jgi:hypothetical protein